jgi:hypothetical protein
VHWTTGNEEVVTDDTYPGYFKKVAEAILLYILNAGRTWRDKHRLGPSLLERTLCTFVACFKVRDLSRSRPTARSSALRSGIGKFANEEAMT